MESHYRFLKMKIKIDKRPKQLADTEVSNLEDPLIKFNLEQ